MRLTVMLNEKILNIELPHICNGKYWIVDDEVGDKLFSIEADEGQTGWVIKSSLTVTVYNGLRESVNKIALNENKICYVQLGANRDNCVSVFVEDDSEAGISYEKYSLNNDCELSIGSNSDCDIIINNQLVTYIHCVIEFKNDVWKLNSNSGTHMYVDRKRFCGSDTIKYGSCIYIYGVKIIVGYGFIAINNPYKSVMVSNRNLEKMRFDEYWEEKAVYDVEEQYYYRAPRFVKRIDPLNLRVDMPTQADKTDDMPMLLTLAPSMIMGIASVLTGVFSVVNATNSNSSVWNTIPTIVMSISMLAGMIIFPVIMKKRELKNKKEKEKYRRTQYMKYLTSLRKEVEKHKKIQEDILNENNPIIVEKTNQDDFWKNGLWSKSANNDDYLFIRLGVGNQPMRQDITYPEERFTLEDDEMREALFRFQKEEKLLHSVPIGLDLKKVRCIGVTGNNKSIINTINLIGMQIALLHGYDEVKIAFLGKEKDLNKIEYLKDINHIWDNGKSKRYLATNEDSARELSSELNKMVLNRLEQKGSSYDEYMIIIIADRKLAKSISFAENLQENSDIKVRIIYCFDDGGELPRECDSIVKLDVVSGIMYENSKDNYYITDYVQDILKIDDCKKIVEKSFRYKINIKDGGNSLPKRYDFMEMFGVGKAEHLNVMNRWMVNSPVQSLKTEVGIDPNGDKFYLDLHEKVHGPHGLIAGMTGSGKFEFIISYILSMAINYHPDEVAFVLIDYKGGGLAKAFKNDKYTLPHIAGVITNLDTTSIYRSILAINSELKQRQNIFNDVKAKHNEATMDIYKYQKLYRAGQVSEPMPHLIIVSDEFAELKSQQPGFMDELISIARIGRSLGVHLILATQKPTGVVNEQIWANSRFKVCLKVQDRSDSMEMLKRDDAAELTDIGRFYLQVGYNELFLLGQSAWSGALYPDTDEYVNLEEKDVEIINELGNTIDKISFNDKEISKNNGEQIVKIIEYLDGLAKDIGYCQRQLWLPELLENVYLNELIAKYGMPYIKESLIAVAGELDDPYNQSQRLLTVDFGNKGNALVYGNSSSGMELFIESVLFSLFEMYSPKEFNAYILDFENESMRKFADIPHVRDVLRDGEDEKISALCTTLSAELNNRRKLLAEYGGNINNYNASSEKILTKILVVISNYAHFIESYEKYEDKIISLCREGMKYGIYFIATANSATSVRYRMSQNFAQCYVLKLNDEDDYTAILGSLGGRVPEKFAGRGMLKEEKSIYTFQAAHYADVNNFEEEKEYIRGFRELVISRYGEDCTEESDDIPEINMDDESDGKNARCDDTAIGISSHDGGTVIAELFNRGIIGIASNEQVLTSRFVSQYIKNLAKTEGVDIRVINGDGEVSFAGDKIKLYSNAKQGLEEIISICLNRRDAFNQGGDKALAEEKQIIVVLNAYSQIKDKIDDYQMKNEIDVMLHKLSVKWKVYVVIAGNMRTITDNANRMWYKERFADNCIWIGDGLNPSYINVKDKEKLTFLADGYGCYCRDGECICFNEMMQ